MKNSILEALKIPGYGNINNTKDVKCFVDSQGFSHVIDLVKNTKKSDEDKNNLDMYSAPVSIEFYENFLHWLFATFEQDEKIFRHDVISRLKLKEGDKVLITSCGFGSDIPICLEFVGETGEVHAQDLSKEMVLYSASRINKENLLFTISNALDLPYKDKYFDAVFHFGGINLFGDMKKSISEMERVCKIGGRVVFGDEGISPHLREKEYGKIVIKNNPLWGLPTPLDLLPEAAQNVELRYILGNCFYLISFEVGEGLPSINLDVQHKGYRGGSMRSRYFGEIAGVLPEIKNNLYAYAKENNTSVHEILNEALLSFMSKK